MGDKPQASTYPDYCKGSHFASEMLHFRDFVSVFGGVCCGQRSLYGEWNFIGYLNRKGECYKVLFVWAQIN